MKDCPDFHGDEKEGCWWRPVMSPCLRTQRDTHSLIPLPSAVPRSLSHFTTAALGGCRRNWVGRSGILSQLNVGWLCGRVKSTSLGLFLFSWRDGLEDTHLPVPYETNVFTWDVSVGCKSWVYPLHKLTHSTEGS